MAKRPLFVALAAVLLAGLLAGDATAAHRADAAKGKRARAAKGQPLSGIYDSCVMPERGFGEPVSCGERLRLIREGGFGLVLNYNTAEMSVADNLAYANLAQSMGLKVAWSLAGRHATLASNLDLVRATSGHPATWGYYIGDEVRPQEGLAQVRQLSNSVRALTNKPLLYVSRPVRSELRPFKGLADYLGPDSYPVGPIDPPTCPTARWASQMVRKPAGPGREYRRARKSGGRGRSRLAIVLQAFSWSVDFPQVNHPWPSAQQMRQMRTAATRCGQPELILWFCFHCITRYSPNPQGFWRDVAWAANDVRLQSVPSLGV
jgi:hypothetical protein